MSTHGGLCLAGLPPALPLSWYFLLALSAVFHVPKLLGWADAMAHFLFSAPIPFLSHCPCSLGCTQAFSSSDRSSLLSPHCFFAQGQIVISPKSLSDDWVRWTHQPVSNYHSGNESQMARLTWKCTSTQVRRTPGWMRPCVYGPVCPVTHAICSQEPCPICPLAPGHGKRPHTGRACRVHRDG